MSLRNAILGLLSQGEKTGFDLIRDFDVERSVVWPAPQNEVYRVLAGLAKDGLIEAAAQGARGAKTYEITGSGRAELAAWLAAPSDYTLRYEPMLKAVFLRDAPPDVRQTRGAMDAAFFEAQVALLEEIHARRLGASDDPRIELRLMALGMYRAFAAWARQVEAEANRTFPLP